MRIVCFGDSITGARPDQPYLHAYLKWPDILGALIEAVTGVPAEARGATPEAAWSFTTHFNDAIARVGAAHGVPVQAMELAFNAARDKFRPAELLDPADGTHLRPAGELVYAQTVLTALRAHFPVLFA